MPVRFQRLVTLWNNHPRLALAVRGAIAASLAWFVAGFLPDPVDDYPYYAPFGAVVATTFSLAGSVRESTQAVSSIALGGAIGWAVGLFSGLPTPLTVGITVALGVLAVGIPWLGEMSSWVPTAAIFTLIVGNGETFYIGVYAGLTLMGAAIGIGVNAIMPPVPMGPAWAAVSELRGALARELDLVADHFEDADDPTPERVHRSSWQVRQARAKMHSAVDLASEAQRGNFRGRWHREAISSLERQSTRMDRLSTVAADLSDLLLQEQHVPTAGQDEVMRLHEQLWPPIIHALRNLAEALRIDGGAHEKETDAIQEAMQQLAELPDEAADRSAHQSVLTDSVLLALRRGLESLG